MSSYQLVGFVLGELQCLVDLKPLLRIAGFSATPHFYELNHVGEILGDQLLCLTMFLSAATMVRTVRLTTAQARISQGTVETDLFGHTDSSRIRGRIIGLVTVDSTGVGLGLGFAFGLGLGTGFAFGFATTSMT